MKHDLNTEMLPDDVFKTVMQIEGYFPLPSILVAVHSVVIGKDLFCFPYSGVGLFLLGYLMASYLTKGRQKTIKLSIIVMIVMFAFYLVGVNIHALSLSRAELGNFYSMFLLTLVLKKVVVFSKVHDIDSFNNFIIITLLVVVAQIFTHYTNMAVTVAIVSSFLIWIIMSYGILKCSKRSFYKALLTFLIIIVLFFIISYNPYIKSSLPMIYKEYHKFLINFSSLYDVFLFKSPISNIIDIKYDYFTGLLLIIKGLASRVTLILGVILFSYSLLRKKINVEGYFILLILFSFIAYTIYCLVAEINISIGIAVIVTNLYLLYCVTIGKRLRNYRLRNTIFSIILALLFISTLTQIMIMPYGIGGNQLLSDSSIKNLEIISNSIDKNICLTGDQMLIFTSKYLVLENGAAPNYTIQLFQNTVLYDSAISQNIAQNFRNDGSILLLVSNNNPVIWGDVFGFTVMKDLITTKLSEYCTSKLFDSNLQLFYIIIL